MKRADPASNDAGPAISWVRRTHAEDELLRAVAQRVRQRHRRRVAMAAAAAVALLVAGVALRPRTTEPRAVIATAAPETRATATIIRPARENLIDGSRVELKDDARIAVDFSPAFRRVRLLHGEAHFQVAPDKSRPFIVEAAGVEVRAVGTAFSVELAPRGVDVLVTEGTVRVAPPPSSAAVSPAEVTAGRRCVVEAAAPTPQVEILAPAFAEERLAWRVPQLEFSRTPLAEVVALVNEHVSGQRQGPLVVADSALHQIKLTGYLRADNIEGLVRLLETNFHVAAERSAAGVVLRERK